MHRALVSSLVVWGAGGLLACGDQKSQGIAELTKADGPVDRQVGAQTWTSAKVGTHYFFGDAARTADGAAQLRISGGKALIAMQPHTILRFGGKDGSRKIALELGAIDVSGDGLIGFSDADVRLTGGTVRLTSKGNGKTDIELTLGTAEVTSTSGQRLELTVGSVVSFGDFDVAVTNVRDAGVPGVALDAAVLVADGGTYDVTGKKAEIQAVGATTWAPLPEGQGVLQPGSKLRLGMGTTARIVARGTTLELGGGTRMTLTEQSMMLLEKGLATAIAAPNAAGVVNVPGGAPDGALAFKAGAQGGEARLDVGPNDTTVKMTRGTSKLAGEKGATLDLTAGETATLSKAGLIREVVKIPRYFDLRLTAGETATVHDARGNPAVQFSFGDKCKDGGSVEMDRDARFLTARISQGKTEANLSVQRGAWAYRVRCAGGAAVASGRISVIADGGARPLPKQPAVNTIEADGRNYRIDYQSVIPTVVVPTKGSGTSFKLHVATGGKEQVFEGKAGKISIPGTKLDEGEYTYWLERDGVKDTKVSTLKIGFDNTAPQVYIERPGLGRAWPEGDLDVRGAVLPGWTASVDSVSIPVDRQHRFQAKVPRPTQAMALAIKLSHPQRGMHYYLRRPGK